MRDARTGIRLFALPAFLALFASAPGAGALSPVLEKLNEAIIFYAGFDGGSTDADMAVGAEKPDTVEGEIKFMPGKHGNAALLGSRAFLTYSSIDNIDFLNPGALSFWVSNYSWIAPGTAEHRGVLNFFRKSAKTSTAAFMIYREGFSKTPRRVDTLRVKFNFPELKSNRLFFHPQTVDWKPGQWHLIAASWDRNGLSVSIDGQDYLRVEFARPLEEQDFPRDSKELHSPFMVGGGSETDELTLMDELTVYNRPLSMEEVTFIWTAGAAKK